MSALIVRPRDGQLQVLKVEHEDERDRQRLHQGGDEIEHHILHRLLGRLDATVHGAHHVAHLLPQVPVQGEAVQVAEGVLRDLDVGRLLHLDVNQALRLLALQRKQRLQDCIERLYIDSHMLICILIVDYV